MGFAGSARFEVVSQLAAGGMGVVYVARDRERGVEVALKTLPGPLDPVALLRFKTEFRAVRDLHHPNLCQLGELFAEGSDWYFTMELVRGTSFLERVRPGGALDEARLRDALLQLARGLAALHSADKVHRDVKPENVLCTAEGRVVIVDFGLIDDGARALGMTDTDLILGSAGHMAPEQTVPGADVTPAADWYALGVMLYQALAGELPFRGHWAEVLARKAGERAPVPPGPPDLVALATQLLERVPARRPSGAAVLRRLGDPAAGARPGVPFVGRAAQLATLDAAFAEARAGRTVVLHLCGESGIGKSALAARFAEAVEDEIPGAVVLRGRASERESVPFRAIDDAVDELSSFLAARDPAELARLVPRPTPALARMFPVLRRVTAVGPPARSSIEAGPSPQELRTRGFAAFRELVGRVAARHPLLLVLDDLQWADADSLALLGGLVRGPSAPPLLLLATVRPPSAVRIPGGSELVLGGLPDDDARRLVELLGAGGDDLVADAAGHPLFLQELARREGRPAARLDEALAARVARLDASARGLLELIAIAGAPLAQEVAGRALPELAGTELARVVAGLQAGRLLGASGGRGRDTVEPYHDRIRVAALARLDAGARRGLHRRLAVVLEDDPRADPETLARHWLGAGEPERAAGHAVRAADRANQALAFARAAELYRRAIDLGRDDLHELLARALSFAGRGVEAAAAFLAAAERRPRDAPALRTQASIELIRSGHIDEGFGHAAAVLAGLGLRVAPTPRRALASLLWTRARLRLRGLGQRPRAASAVPAAELANLDLLWSIAGGIGLVDTIRGADFQARHLLAALRAGEPYRVARALALEAAYLATAGARTAPRTTAILADARRLSDEPHALAIAALAGGITGILQGRFRDALAACGEAEELLRERCTGVMWELGTARIHALLALLYLGEMRELTRRAPRVLAEAEERGDLNVATYTQVSLLSFTWLGADDPAGSLRLVDEAMARWTPRGYQVPHYAAALARGQAHLYAGDGEAALAEAVRARPGLASSLLDRVEQVKIEANRLAARGGLMAAASATGRDRARRVARALAATRRVASAAAGYAGAYALLLEAGGRALLGEQPRALALLAAAERGFAAEHMRLMVSVARRRRGELLGGDGGAELVSAADEAMRADGILARAHDARTGARVWLGQS